jgi:short-subunit dehydrogenase
LINVAGLDYEGEFLERTHEQFMSIIKVNIDSTVDTTHAILGLRDPEKRFMLINVCSLAAFYPMPYKAIYAASKRFLLDFSLAVREEIKSFGSVTALCPAGLPTTPDVMQKIFAQGFWGKVTTEDTARVAHRTVKVALRGRAIFIPGWINQLLQFFGSFLPPTMLARYVGKRWQTARNDELKWTPSYRREALPGA